MTRGGGFFELFVILSTKDKSASPPSTPTPNNYPIVLLCEGGASGAADSVQVRFWFLTPSPGPPRLLCARVARQVRSFGELLDDTVYPFILVFDSRTTTLC